MSLDQLIILILRLVCYIVLLFYLSKVLIFIFKGEEGDDPRRMREAMALGYTGVAAYFISFSTGAIELFVNNVIAVSGLTNIPPNFNIVLTLCAGVICVAFICNFSRSLWMLKSLDHGELESVPNWKELTKPLRNRIVEFIPRAVAAILFIFLELKLERLAESGLTDEVKHLSAGESPHQHLADAGKIGLFLYGFLIVWWLVSKLVVKAEMKVSLLLFFCSGMFNSFFILLYGRRTVSAQEAWWMIFIVIIMTVPAAYMLFTVFMDMIGKKPLTSTPRPNDERDLANAK